MKLEFKNDKYRKSRGGYSRILDIFCANCGEYILTYQKDGVGSLKRLYFDRIFLPESISRCQNLPLKSVPNLVCNNCEQRIGAPYIYDKECRNAFILNQGSFSKKIRAK